MLRRCFNPKVLIGLAAVGVAAAVSNPGLFAVVFPLLILSACPLSMLLMGRMGMSHGASVAGVYTCPMHPEVRTDKPGRCPKCGMTLVGAAKQEPRVEAAQPSIEELQARLEAVTEQRAALARELEVLQKTSPEATRTVLEEAESVARAASERH